MKKNKETKTELVSVTAENIFEVEVASKLLQALATKLAGNFNRDNEITTEWGHNNRRFTISQWGLREETDEEYIVRLEDSIEFHKRKHQQEGENVAEVEAKLKAFRDNGNRVPEPAPNPEDRFDPQDFAELLHNANDQDLHRIRLYTDLDAAFAAAGGNLNDFPLEAADIAANILLEEDDFNHLIDSRMANMIEALPEGAQIIRKEVEDLWDALFIGVRQPQPQPQVAPDFLDGNDLDIDEIIVVNNELNEAAEEIFNEQVFRDQLIEDAEHPDMAI